MERFNEPLCSIPNWAAEAEAVLGDGHTGRWEPEATVQHLIPRDRATTKYVCDYVVGQGQNLVLKDKSRSADTNQLKIEDKAEYRRFWRKRFFAGNQQWCSHLVRSALDMGQWLVRADSDAKN